MCNKMHLEEMATNDAIMSGHVWTVFWVESCAPAVFSGDAIYFWIIFSSILTFPLKTSKVNV